MNFIETPLAKAYIIELTPFSDERGLFMRTFCKNEFKKIGHTKEFVQFNQSINKKKGTLRGMHFQKNPYTEVKLIRCISGSVFDVIVDIRKDSKTFLHSFGIELSKDNMKMIYVPEGFAHGFLTLTDDAELLYHHTEFYSQSADSGLRFDDPLLNIKWYEEIKLVSTKDKNYPLLENSFQGISIAF